MGGAGRCKCHLPISADEYREVLCSLSKRGIPISEVSSCLVCAPATTDPTPVLKGYRPVKISDRVGEHSGVDQKFVNFIPRSASKRITGVMAVSVVVL